MNRPFEFRAWDLREKKWIQSATPGLLIDICLDIPKLVVLMQFTGLLDKNGKKIWEGDIVRAEHSNYYDESEDEPEYFPWIGEIKYSKCGYVINTNLEYIPYSSNIRILTLEAIGTIHDKEE